ncbi:hypothetical protein PCE1_000083 [Barthelona sp. PCE]
MILALCEEVLGAPQYYSNLNIEDFILEMEQFGLLPIDAKLHHACFSGAYNDAARYIEDGADVHSKGFMTLCPLHIAALVGSFRLAQALLEAGADKCLETEEQRLIPFDFALLVRSYTLAQILLPTDPDRCLLPQRTCEILISLAERIPDEFLDLISEEFRKEGGRVFQEAIKRLKELDASQLRFVRTSFSKGLSAKKAVDLLQFGVKTQQIELIKLLCDFGCDCNDWTGPDAPFFTAVARLQVEIVQLLLDFGADVNRIGSDEHLLCFLARTGYFEHVKVREIIEQTLESGVEIPTLDMRGSNMPIDITTAFTGEIYSCDVELTEKEINQRSTFLFELLIEKGIELNHLDSDHNGAIHYAMRECNGYFVRKLLDSNVDLSLRDKDNNQPLHLMLKHFDLSEFELLNELVFAGASVSERGWKQTSILHILGERWEPQHLEAFITAVDVNCVDDEGLTPLHYAIRSELGDNARCLIKHGADVNINIGEHPFHFAISLHLTEMVEILHEYDTQIDVLVKGVPASHRLADRELDANNRDLPVVLDRIGLNLNYVYEGQTVLDVAYEKNYPVLIDALVMLGVKRELPTKVAIRMSDEVWQTKRPKFDDFIKDMLASLLDEKPDNVVDHMEKWLNEVDKHKYIM